MSEIAVCRSLPWLDEFASRDSVVEAYRTRGGEALGMAPRAPLEVGLLLVERDRARAQAILRDYLSSDWSPVHREWVETVLRLRGLRDFIPSSS
jgi:hypothetical protein